MRVVVLLLVLLLALVVPPAPAAAQEAGPPLLEDEAGDVMVRGGAAGEVASPAATDRVDLRSLHLTETPTSLEALVTVHAMESDPQVFHRVQVLFDYAGRGYRAFGFHQVDSSYYAYLDVRDDATGRYSRLDTIPSDTDPAAATIGFSIPREHIVGADGAPLFPGRSLEAVRVVSTANEFLFLGPDEPVVGGMHDHMGEATLPLRLGVAQTGHARLSSDAPFRSSNGAATTFVFRVEARSLADADDRFTLALQDVPAGWDVTLPVDRLVLEPGQTQTVPVVVRTPFVHQHGSAQQFLLTMTSDSDADSVGRIQVGVRYPEIPQPAGHHDTLWLHGMAAPDDALTTSIGLINEAIVGRGDWASLLLMNAVETEERFEDSPIKGYACQTGDNGTSPLAPTYCWDVFLDPRLDMGLDFDLTRTGAVEVPVHALVPTNGARLTGELLWFGPPQEEENQYGYTVTTRETVVLADLTGGQPHDIGLDGEALLEATIVPRAEADLVRYQKDAGLVLRLRLETDRVDYAFLGPHEEPEVMPGGVLRLPLLEYADPVDDVFSGARSIRIDAVTEQERLLNPGDTAVFTVDVAHLVDGRDSYSARVVGGNVEWATLLGPGTFTLRDNGTQRLSVSVLAPDDARDGDQADLVLEVASNSDLGARALVRLVATVATDAEHPDDAEQAAAIAREADKKSPGAGAASLALVLAAVAAVAARRRRT